MKTTNAFPAVSSMSDGEAESLIANELYGLQLISYRPSASNSPMPEQEEALAAVNQETRTYGLLVHHALHAWFVRADCQYDVFVNQELDLALLQVLGVISMSLSLIASRARGWTHLRVCNSNELAIVVNALRLWSSAEHAQRANASM